MALGYTVLLGDTKFCNTQLQVTGINPLEAECSFATPSSRVTDKARRTITQGCNLFSLVIRCYRLNVCASPEFVR